MRALEGIRVLDLTNALAGSSSTRLLAAHGAEVIKVERPDGGDFTRDLMPFLFRSHNRGKRSVVLDLTTEGGRRALHALARDADVAVQSYRPGVAAALGFDRDTLSEINPRLIYASFSAFNPNGTSAARRGVDAVIQAESGMVEMQGGLLGNLSYVDATAGLALSHAILAALIRRDRTGEADCIDVNLFDTALYMQAVPLTEFAETGRLRDQSSYLIQFPAVGLFPARDGRIQVAAYHEHDWTALCEVIGRPELAGDPRFATGRARERHNKTLRAELNIAFQARDRAYWVRELSARNILCGAVRDYTEVMGDTDSHAAFAGSPDSADFAIRPPYTINRRPADAGSPAPALGADNDAMFATKNPSAS